MIVFTAQFTFFVFDHSFPHCWSLFVVVVPPHCSWSSYSLLCPSVHSCDISMLPIVHFLVVFQSLLIHFCQDFSSYPWCSCLWLSVPTYCPLSECPKQHWLICSNARHNSLLLFLLLQNGTRRLSSRCCKAKCSFQSHHAHRLFCSFLASLLR